eukprot:TRINITY_DN3724_c0_g1_i3.p1 TRINITY_DN3724_c0_g1~~TRINITY_DN3724_c0_g1_i3.p1  ORF type:complete len:365 (-),score=109.24 TRINITY_DN3724_c0_g1_i3:163-1257(-)
MYIFQTIDNFRDVSRTVQLHVSEVTKCVMYRSATLDYASDEEIEKLVNDLDLTTILDLRSELEAQLSKNGKPFITFPIAATMKLTPIDILTPHPSSHPSPSSFVQKKLNSTGTRQTIMINFAGKKFRKNAVWKAATMKTKCKIAKAYISGHKPAAAKVVGEQILSKGGLDGLYRSFIDHCDAEICQALCILSSPSNYPILVHCTQGKDRTGLVTALALAAVGIEEEKIIEDYARSREGLLRVKAHMISVMAKDGLDASFAESPPECMRKTFDYMREKYGSVMGYLDYIGFHENARKLLASVISPSPNHPPPPFHDSISYLPYNTLSFSSCTISPDHTSTTTSHHHHPHHGDHEKIRFSQSSNNI